MKKSLGLLVLVVFLLSLITVKAQAAETDYPDGRVTIRAFRDKSLQSVVLVDAGNVDYLPDNWDFDHMLGNVITVSFPVEGGFFNIKGSITFYQYCPEGCTLWPFEQHMNYVHPIYGPVLAIDGVTGKMSFTKTIPANGVLLANFDDVRLEIFGEYTVNPVPLCTAPYDKTFAECLRVLKRGH